jgi:hypothetical protein
MHCVAREHPLDLPFGEVARFMCPLPLHLSPCAQEHQCPSYGLRGKTRVWKEHTNFKKYV